jgi:hypothetical protein
MSDWFYARDGRQEGPVSFGKLGEIARSGGLNPDKDLVWTSTMKDWTPAGKIEGLFSAAPPSGVPADPSNPYAAPQSAWVAPVVAVGALEEIAPGSEPIIVTACVKRSFDLCIRRIGSVLLLSVGYIVFSNVLPIVLAAMDRVLGLPPLVSVDFIRRTFPEMGDFAFFYVQANPASWVNIILSSLISIFIMLGLVRMALNLVTGREVSASMLFSGGRKVLPALIGSIIFYVAMFIGFLLLVVPGFYIMLRYGMFMYAMVDRDLGVMDSFAYSSRITTNNRWRLCLLTLLGMVILFAGLLALCVGIVFALPVFFLCWVVAYRWMQYGHRAALDIPGSQTPMLAGV